MNKCKTCGAPAKHTAPDGDFKYVAPIKSTSATPSLETIIAKIEAEKLDEKDLHINHQIEPFNTALDKVISIIREEWGK